MNNKIPKELENRQEQIRNETINIVLRAIVDLEKEGLKPRIKDLIEYTRLSRSTFSKKHVRNILIEKGIVIIKNEVKTSKSNARSNDIKIKLKLSEKDETIKKLREENIELTKECELLRGKLFLLMQKNHIDLSKI